MPEELFSGSTQLCPGCTCPLGLKLALKTLGKKTIVVNASGCMTFTSFYPYSSVKVPFIHVDGDVAAVSTGIYSAYKQKKEHVNILIYAGDGATYDTGLQSLSAACQRGDDFIYVCYNNQGSMSAGIQKSGATPFGATTATNPCGKENEFGNLLHRKPMERIIASHKIPYVATACISFPDDYMEKITKASHIIGPKFIDLLCPCPVGWGFKTDEGVEIGRLAVQTGIWPLYEIDRGKVKITCKPKRLRPMEDYLSRQKRFSHLKDRQIETIKKITRERWKELLRGEWC